MPILTSQPEATDSLATHHATLQRRGGGSVGSNVSPPRDLLPSVASWFPLRCRRPHGRWRWMPFA